MQYENKHDGSDSLCYGFRTLTYGIKNKRKLKQMTIKYRKVKPNEKSKIIINKINGNEKKKRSKTNITKIVNTTKQN